MRRETAGSPSNTCVSISSMSLREALDDRGVPVDDRVEDRVEHRLGPGVERIRASTPSAARTSDRSGDSLCRTVMTKLGPANTFSSPNSTRSLRVVVAGRLQHHEEGVAVALDLGALVGVDRILDRELVQVELRRRARRASRASGR